MNMKKDGLTLIELLISVMLISVMLVAVWMVYSAGFGAFYTQLARYDIKDETSLALITITKELHQAVAVTDATASSITFTADLDNDGVNKEIQYIWAGPSGAPLNKVTDAVTTKALINSVQNFTLSYYGAGNILIPAPVNASGLSKVRLVAIDITAVKGDEVFHLCTKVFLQAA
jgi:prepilin-type N-terminal cleavage/methylation domain-containing protein